MRECPGTRDRLQAEPGSILTKPDQGRQVRRREPERVQHPDLVIRVLKVTKQWWPPEAEMEALISRISPTFSQRESRVSSWLDFQKFVSEIHEKS